MASPYVVSYATQQTPSAGGKTAVVMLSLHFESNSRAKDAVGNLKVCVESCEGLVEQKQKKPAYYMKM